MLPFDMHPLAATEVDVDAAWMDERFPGRGDDFRAAVADTIEFVCKHPQVGTPQPEGGRKRRVLDFEHAVISRDEPDRVYVLAVVHAKRRPGYWVDRLSEEN
jgi:plasmid stabilization system protein ParE